MKTIFFLKVVSTSVSQFQQKPQFFYIEDFFYSHTWMWHCDDFIASEARSTQIWSKMERIFVMKFECILFIIIFWIIFFFPLSAKHTVTQQISIEHFTI